MWAFELAGSQGRLVSSQKPAKYTGKLSHPFFFFLFVNECVVGHDMMVQHASLRGEVNNNIDSPKQHSITATEASYVHEARRQGPIFTTTQAISPGPGPASILTSTTTSDPGTTTMSPTSTTEPSSTAISTPSPTPSNSPSSVTPTSYSSAGTSSTTLQPSSSSSSSSSSSPSPSPTSLDFTVQNMTTCTSALISWNYSGKEAELFLSITNVGFSVDDVVASSRVKARQGPAIVVQNQLVDTNTSAQSWTWSPVNVTQGWYEVKGLALTSPNLRSSSAPFFVSNGTDVTCLTGISTPLSGSSPSSSHSAHTASIVGGVVGAIVGVALIVFAGLYLRSRRRGKLLFGGVGFRRRKWGSLNSTASSIQPGRGGSASQRASSNFHDHSESTGAVLQDISGGKVSATTTPGASDEDVVVMGEEKLVSPASSTGMNPFDVLNTPAHYDRRASLYSDQTPPAVANEASRSRAASLRMSAQSLNQNLEQQAQRIRNSMETTARRRSDRLSMPSLPSPGLTRLPHSPILNQPQEEYPLSPVTPIPVNRSISYGAGSVVARRTPRKPVPQFNPSLLLETTKADSVSTFTGGAESSQSHGTGMATGTNGTPPDMDGFGDGRPVHYLIPDMPPPQQD
ncbi:hypothetical protein JVU11DRAFT_8073 [Chiua virens]|nr:hypothetical protein JVU11DRAFT_8073 [Chiua virens]